MINPYTNKTMLQDWDEWEVVEPARMDLLDIKTGARPIYVIQHYNYFRVINGLEPVGHQDDVHIITGNIWMQQEASRLLDYLEEQDHNGQI